MWIDLILLKKAPAECRKFEKKMADVENKTQEGENIYVILLLRMQKLRNWDKIG